MDLNPGRHGGGKHLRDGAVEFLDDVQFFDAAFAQLRVAHDLGDDLVGARHFLLDDFDLLRDFGLAVAQGALQRKCGVVDDGQRIFDLMRKLGGQPCRRNATVLRARRIPPLPRRPAAGVPAAPARRNSKPSSATAPPAAAQTARPNPRASVRSSARQRGFVQIVERRKRPARPPARSRG